MNSLLSDTLWNTLDQLAHSSSSKHAAVAYVTSDEHIIFNHGDVLVVDASDSAIINGQTDARVLERAFTRGAVLYSCPGLHAKVLVFDRSATIGSANLSWYSRNALVEAAWLSDESATTAQALAFIENLSRTSDRIDEAFIDRIKQLEVRPRAGSGYAGPRSYRRQRPHPILLYFQEILPGDVRKYHTSSADAQSGGGARDLRISPAATYEPVLSRMFSSPTGQPGVREGEILWTTPSGDDEETVVELWPPTVARPNELRIGRFYDIGGWNIDEDQFDSEQSAGFRWFFILEMGATGLVTARLLQQQHVDLEDPLVAQHIANQLSNTTAGHAARGAVDFQARSTYPS